MKRRFYRIATWQPLIVVVALGLRLGFAWDQERQIPRDLVGLVPFMQETGNIAFSIALGQGFGSPYWQDTGPTAWLTPVYPYMVAGAYQPFRDSHPPRVLRNGAAEHLVFGGDVHSDLLHRQTRRRAGSRELAAWLWAVFPTRGLFRSNGFGTRRFPRW